MSTDPPISPSTSAPAERSERRSSDRWTPPVTAIRDVRHILVVDSALLLILLGTLFFVVPGTVRAIYGSVEGLRTPVHLGPAMLIAIAAGLALISLVAAAHAVATGHPMIMRGVSSASGRSSHKLMRAALLTAVLAFVQLLVFSTMVPIAL